MSALTDDLPSAALAARRLYDPAFKLFGRTIPVSTDCPGASDGGRAHAPPPMPSASGHASSVQNAEDESPELEDAMSIREELGSSSGSNEAFDDEKLVELINDQQEGPPPRSSKHIDEATNHLCASNADAHVENAGAMDNQTSQKPDKPIPCPRCHSMDTKFCYFNNYNVNQPRHFCKNCQRYWTAGGTLRNVPVGAGRRKNKHSSPQARSVPPELLAVRGDPVEDAQQLISCPTSAQIGMNLQTSAGVSSASVPGHAFPLDLQSTSAFENSSPTAVLSFGQESPACLTGGAPSFTSCRSEVFQGYKQQSAGRVQVEESLSDGMQKFKDAVANTASICTSGDGKLQSVHLWQTAAERSVEPEGSASATPKPDPVGVGDFTKYMDAALAWASGGPFSFMGLPWHYGAGLGWANTSAPVGHGNAGLATMTNASSGTPNVLEGVSGPCSIAVPQQGVAFGGQAPWPLALRPWAGAVPWPIMQNPMWVPPGWAPPWTMPWAAPITAAAAAAAAAASTAVIPEFGTTILGKHAREPEAAAADAYGEKGRPPLIPKTLRIDDPGEAARSSIWSTLGIDLCSDSLTGGGMFRGLQSKTDALSNDPHSLARNLNPAAMSRLMKLQESNSASPAFDAKNK